MRKTRALAVTLLLAAFLMSAMPSLVHAQGGPSSYYVISLDANIDPGTQNFVTSSISDAQSAGANHIVLILNTFGGDGQSMDNIIQAISSYESSGGTFITLIGPYGAHAFSAGSYIAESSNKIYMMNGTVIGSATPIVSDIPTGETNTTMTKDIDGFTAFMQALTANFGRNDTAAGKMVSNGVSYVAMDALRLHVVDGIVNASSVAAALVQLGVPANTPTQSEGVSSELISILSDPNLSSVLFLAGILAIMVDLFHPTFILSGAGAAAIVLALIGFGYFGAPLSAVLLMFIGAAFIFLEVKTHHGVSAIGGVVIFAIGVLLVFQNTSTPAPISPEIVPPANTVNPDPVTFGILAVLGVLVVIGSIYLYKLRRDLDRRKTGLFEMKRMIGKEGVLTSDLKAGMQGTANIGSEDWSVTGSKDLVKGTRVKVKETDGYKLIVEGA
ncbi:MAG: NfeD family protein [Nitrososphaerales archaeon]